MKRILISASALLLMTTTIFAQEPKIPVNWQKKTAKALKIGDMMPDYTFPSVSQYGKPSLNLSDFKGKLIIIDFWFVGCTSCFDFFPHLQKLQDEFKDKIQIIAANDFFQDDWPRINKSIARFKKATGYKFDLPVALYDSTIYDYFPHKGPEDIIIDPNGKIVAITNLDDVTKERIQAVLEGKSVDFTLKDDFWNSDIPFVTAFNQQDKDDIFVNSSLIKYRTLPGDANWGGQYNDKGEYIGTRTIFCLIDGYSDAYPYLFRGGPQVEYETSNELFKQYADYPDSNRFIYDLIVKPRAYKGEELNSFYSNCLRTDLDKAFNFSLRKGKKMYPCLVIRTNKNISKSYSKRPASEESDDNLLKYRSATRNHIQVFAHKMHIDFLDQIRNEFHAVKIIDETTLGKKELDIDFPVGIDFSDNAKMAAFLSSRGIDVTVENRELDCIIVGDKKPGEPTVLSK